MASPASIHLGNSNKANIKQTRYRTAWGLQQVSRLMASPEAHIKRRVAPVSSDTFKMSSAEGKGKQQLLRSSQRTATASPQYDAHDIAPNKRT
jgi:hypothetical protein